MTFFFVFQSNLTAQSEKGKSSFSILIENGISNHIYFNDTNEEGEIAFVNAIGLYYSFAQSSKLNSFLGIQYNKNGFTTDWICDTNWDYCSTIGTPPIDVITVHRLHYLSLVFNLKYLIKKDFYFRGGLSIDVPFNESFTYKYTDANSVKSKDQDWNRYGRRVVLNTSLGANLTLGKSFFLNKKLEWFAEVGFKMYNLIGIRFEDYEYYLLERKQKPYVISINLGLSLR